MSLFHRNRRPPSPPPAPPRPPALRPVFFKMDPALMKADLTALRGRTERDAVLGPVLRVLVEVRAGMLAAAEVSANPHPERSIARASGVSAAIDAILAATRGAPDRHQDTGFGKKDS